MLIIFCLLSESLNTTTLSSTNYMLKLNSTSPFMLSFAETYDPQWEARIMKDDKVVDKIRPVMLNGVINGFWINKTGESEVNVVYKPQESFELGLFISLGTLLIVIGYLVFNVKRNNQNEEQN